LTTLAQTSACALSIGANAATGCATEAFRDMPIYQPICSRTNVAIAIGMTIRGEKCFIMVASPFPE
jgi:hypothetical protein